MLIRKYTAANDRKNLLKTNNNKRWKNIRQWLTSDAMGFESQSLLVILSTTSNISIFYVCYVSFVIFSNNSLICTSCWILFYLTHRLFWSLLLRSCLTRLIDWWSSSERKSFSNKAPMSFFLFWYSIIDHDEILEKEKSSLKHFLIIGAVGPVCLLSNAF